MRVIQVGVGGMGKAWLSAVQESAHVDYAALVEIDDDIAAAQVSHHHLDEVPVFRTLCESLESVDTQGVINVTPPQFHKDVSVTALDKGVPVLSEKTLAHNFDSAKRIVDRANATGVLHMVAQNYRYCNAIQTLKSALSSDEMGPVGSVTLQFFRGRPRIGGFREEMPYPLIVDMSIHHFDLMRFLVGSAPVSLYGRSWNPPWSWFAGDVSAAVTLTFGDDVVVSYSGSWCSQARDMS